MHQACQTPRRALRDHRGGALARLAPGLLVALLATMAPRPASADGLRMDDAIRLALDRNERARIAGLRVDVASAQLERARAPFLPTVNFGFSSGVAGYPDRSGRSWTHGATLTATQPLLTPSSIPLHAQAEHNLRAEEHNAVEQQRTLAFDTAKAFVVALANEQVLVASEARLARARNNLSNAEARAAAQLNSTNDATKTRIDVATAAQSVAQGTGTLQRARVQLALLVGQEEIGGLEAPEAAIQAATAFQGDAAQLSSAAVDARPDLRALRSQVRAAHEFAKEPHYRMIPSVSLVGQMRANPDPQPTDRWHSETLTLNLSWTIFDGGSRYGDRKARLAQAQSSELDLHLAKRTVSTAVRAALASLAASRESVRAAEQGVEAAKANSEETAILYQQGLARAIEVTDANARRFDAEVGLVSARLSLIQSYLELRQALGLFPVDNVGPKVERRSEEAAQ
jgi:outer membrane protein TolC